MAGKFLDYYNTNLKSPILLEKLLDGMQQVFVNASVKSEINAACQVYNTISQNLRVWLVKPKKTAEKSALSSLLGIIFYPVAEAPLGTVDNEARTSAKGLYDIIEANMKKTKNQHLLTLAVCSLCVTSAQIFHDKFDHLLEQLLVQPKEQFLRTSLLESLYTLVYSSMTTYDDKNEARRQRVRGSIASNLFPSNKKLLHPIELEHIDIIVDIIDLLSTLDIESVVSSIILPMIQINQQPFNYEYLIIGFLSFIRIYNRTNMKNIQIEVSPLLQSFYNHPRCIFRKRTLQKLLDSKSNELLSAKIGEAHLKQAIQNAATIISTLHPTISTYTLASNKITLENIPRDKLFQIYAIEATVSTLRICIPNNLHCNELFNYLSHYTIHLSPGLIDDSIFILKYIMKHKPAFRYALASSYNRFVRTIPDSEQQLIHKTAVYYFDLLSIWYQEMQNPSFSDGSPGNFDNPFDFEGKADIPNYNFSSMEAIGLFYMCNSNINTREIGYNTIKLISDIHSLFIDSSLSSTPYVTLHSILLENNDAIMDKCTLEPFYKVILKEFDLDSTQEFLLSSQSNPSVINSMNSSTPSIPIRFSTSTGVNTAPPTATSNLNKQSISYLKENRLVSVLHFLCFLKKENDLRSEQIQFQWMRILASVIEFICEYSPEISKEFWRIIKDRVLLVQNQTLSEIQYKYSTSSPSNAFSLGSINNNPSSLCVSNNLTELGVLWGNYMHAAISSCAINDGSIFDANSSSTSADTILHSSRDLFKIIIPLVRSEYPIISAIVQSSFSFLPSLGINSLLVEVSSYERAAFVDDKVKKQQKQQIAIMLSFIYRIIAENKFSEYLFDDISTLKHHLQFITNQLDKLDRVGEQSSQSNVDNPLDVLFWRFNICSYLSKIFHEVITVKNKKCRDFLDNQLFERIFSFLIQCSGFGDNANSLNDIQKSKERKNLMSYLKQKSVAQPTSSLAHASMIGAPSGHPSPSSIEDTNKAMKDLFEYYSDAIQLASGKALVHFCYGTCDDDEEKRKFCWIGNIFSSNFERVFYSFFFSFPVFPHFFLFFF